ncbi:MAG: YihY/virulence factor BrkB family protein [Dehalococcoidia bacterium]
MDKGELFLLVKRTIKEYGDDDCTHMAAGIAYYGVFSLFPLLLAGIFILSLLLESSTIQEEVLKFASDNFPVSATLITDNIDGAKDVRGFLGPIAVIGLLWSGSAVFGVINRSVNRAWDIEQKRPFFLQQVRRLAMAFTIGILFLLSLGVSSGLAILRDTSSSVAGFGFLQNNAVWEIMGSLLPALFSFTAFALIYRFIPNTKVYWYEVWPGALFATILYEAGKFVFIWYVGNVASLDRIYGSVASVLVLFLWAYVSANILLLGAEVSSEYGRLKRASDSNVEKVDEPVR